jgi:hypothetical protein
MFVRSTYPSGLFGSFSIDYISASSAALSLLEITGPGEVAENSVAGYRAIAHYDNDSTQDVTGSAEWDCEPNTLGEIDDNGLLSVGSTNRLEEVVTVSAEYGEGEILKAEKQVAIFAVCPSGSALEFDGVDDYVDVPYISAYQLPVFTVSAWVYPTTDLSTNGAAIVARGEDAISDNWALVWRVAKSGSVSEGLSIAYEGNGDQDYYWHTGFFPPINAWTHTAATRSSDGTLSIYVNGNLHSQWESTPTPTVNCFQNFAIGANWFKESGTPFVTSFFPGKIDETAIYNRALSAEEVQALMYGRPDGNDPSLVGYWDFDEDEGQYANDSSDNGNTGTLGISDGNDPSDPNWVGSDVPLVPCTLEGLVERNLNSVLDTKLTILEMLQEAMATELVTCEVLDESFHGGEYGGMNKGNVVKAKQKINSAVQHEEQAEDAVNKSIDNIEDSIDALMDGAEEEEQSTKGKK